MKLLYVILLCAFAAYGDGLSPQPLEKVLNKAHAVVKVKIQSLEELKVIQDSTDRDFPSVVHQRDMKVKILDGGQVYKRGSQKKIRFSETYIQNMWIETPASGMEWHIKPGKAYTFIFEKSPNELRLIRIENGKDFPKISRQHFKIKMRNEKIRRDQLKLKTGFYKAATQSTATQTLFGRFDEVLYISGKCPEDYLAKNVYHAASQDLYIVSLEYSQKPPACIWIEKGVITKFYNHGLAKEILGKELSERSLQIFTREKKVAEKFATFLGVSIKAVSVPNL